MANQITVLRRANGKLLSSDRVKPIDLAEKYVPSFRAPRLSPPPLEVVNNYAEFFKYGGGVLHPRLRDKNGFPIRVLNPAPYQIKFAAMERGVLLASNKIGKTKGELINDFRTRLQPKYAGFDCLLVAQNQTIADQHLLELKKWILQSEKLNQFLITHPEKRFKRLPEEKSKMTMAYIENPYDQQRPSRIIAIGFSEALAYSWQNVNRLHVSDPGQIKAKANQTSFFSGLFSRLSNTEGQIKFEGVAGERIGYWWDLCRVLFGIEDQYEDEQDIQDPDRLAELDLVDGQNLSKSFEKMMITADDAIKEGVITERWLNWIKGILSKSELERLYYCKFRKPEGAIFGEFATGEHAPLGLEDIV